MIAIADTETTGFPRAGDKVQPGQARVCQLAVLLCDDDGKHMTEFSTLVRLEKDTIMTEGAQKVHGITWELCDKYGLDSHIAIHMFRKIVSKANILVFHNQKFDIGMLEIEAAYADLSLNLPPTFCTMMATMDICQLPGKFGNYKWPKLAEALPILCGKPMGEDAHDAMVDTKGAKDLYFELKKRGRA